MYVIQYARQVPPPPPLPRLQRLGVSAVVAYLVAASVYTTTYLYYLASPLAGYLLAPSALWLTVATSLCTVWTDPSPSPNPSPSPSINLNFNRISYCYTVTPRTLIEGDLAH